MKQPFLLLLLLLLSANFLSAQCFCEDCPEPIIFDTPTSASLTVSGATNNTLGQNGQSLTNVSVTFVHEAAEEMSMRLVAPNGSFVDLTIGEGIDAGNPVFFDINFIPCSGTPLPDCTNNAIWTSTDNWGEGPYSGSYFPESGCLEDLTGDINGTWTLEMNDVFVVEDGELICFALTFADNSGLSCNTFSCATDFCLAQGGLSIQPPFTQAAEGDPSLLIDFTATAGECQTIPSLPNYAFVYVIVGPNMNLILDIVEGPVDLTTYDEGNYLIYGLSILASDLPIILSQDFSSTNYFDFLIFMSSNDICFDPNNAPASVSIEGCLIDFTGQLESDFISAEIGDPSLDPDWDITWDPAAPDPAIWDVIYVVWDADGDLLIAYLDEDDFTSLGEGNWEVFVLVYLIEDQSLLPPIDGNSTLDDLNNAIFFGDLCAYQVDGSNLLEISAPCLIDMTGSLEVDDITAPQNDPALDPDWDITFGSGTSPDPAVYGFYFVVVNADTDELVAYYTTDDFTLLLEGNYFVTVVYYELDDLSLLPPPNGTNTFADLVALIDNDEICATFFGDNPLTITAPCEADAGVYFTGGISECEGSPELVLDLTPQYAGTGPSSAEYGFYNVVSENGVIIAISEDNDFTGYAVGTYVICGLSYLLTDETLIPDPDGVLTTADIQQDISDQLYCADLMTSCLTLFIEESPNPIFSGPLEVCAGEEVIYTVDNYNGNNGDYLFSIGQGSFFQFIISFPIKKIKFGTRADKVSCTSSRFV